ncbi:MAG: CotH kinase family protein [Oscillospiraceae bacterium]|nr:CotH kinase family protein [Oscillospiraceae bacterium]
MKRIFGLFPDNRRGKLLAALLSLSAFVCCVLIGAALHRPRVQAVDLHDADCPECAALAAQRPQEPSPDAALFADDAMPAADVTTTTAEPLKYESVPVKSFRVSDISPQVKTDADYVDWWFSEWEDCRYVFLPATADRTKLTITVSSSKQLYLNDVPVKSGAVTDLLSTADSFQVRVGEQDCGELRVMQSDRPVVYLSMKTGSLSYVNAKRTHEDSGAMLALNADGSVEYDGEIEKLGSHGNSSWDYSRDKKPYNLKLPEKAKLYGMGKAKKWVLHGNYLDHSMLRNTLGEELAVHADTPFNPQYAYVDLYADGSYRGTYEIFERVQIQKHRVNITDLEEETEALNDKELDQYPQKVSGAENLTDYQASSFRYYDIPNNPADITGGYLFQTQLYNRYPNLTKTDSGFVTARGQAFKMSGPQYASKAQMQYISSFVQDFEDALYSETGYNKKGRHYSDYADVDSIIIGYLIQEIMQDVDGQQASFFFWKESDLVGDGKLHCGPAWDFDLSLCNFSRSVDDATGQWLKPDGSPMRFYTALPTNLYVMHQPVHGYGHIDEAAPLGWLGTLYLKEEQRVGELYYEKFDGFLRELTDKTQENGALITRWGEELLLTGDMNNARWHMYGGKPYKQIGPEHGKNYTECVEYLRNYLSKHYVWMHDFWAPQLGQSLAEALPDALEGLQLERYDDEGREALDAAVEEGKKAIAAANTYQKVQDAYSDALAAIHDIPMKEITGDFNDDGTTDLQDAQDLLVYYVNSLAKMQTDTVSATQRRNGDVDANGRLNAVDALHILRYGTMKMVGLSAEYRFPKQEAEAD